MGGFMKAKVNEILSEQEEAVQETADSCPVGAKCFDY